MSKLVIEKIRDVGLDPATLIIHEQRVLEKTRQAVSPSTIHTEACTVNNLGIVSRETASQFVCDISNSNRDSEFFKWRESQIISVVLAAGAATRFLADLRTLANTQIRSMRTKIENIEAITQRIKATPLPLLAYNWNRGILREPINKSLKSKFPNNPLGYHCKKDSKLLSPDVFEKFFSELNQSERILVELQITKIFFNHIRNTSKILIPLNPDGDSLIDFIIWQQANLLPTAPLNLIASPDFAEQVKKSAERSVVSGFSQGIIAYQNFTVSVIKQDHELDTIRFLENGEPLIEDNGNYSPVPAGHGEIIKMFNSISETRQDSNCILLQTMDNIFGKTDEVSTEFNKILLFFYRIKNCIDSIRLDISNIIFRGENSIGRFYFHSREAKSAINSLLKIYMPHMAERVPEQDGYSLDFTYSLIERIFFLPQHLVPESNFEKMMLLRRHLLRPITVLGMVEKRESDFGGHPVFRKTPTGEIIKICLESSRFTELGFSQIFEMPLETHFNSAIAVVETKMSDIDQKTGREILTRVDFNDFQDDEIYLISKKKHHGHTVYYHETAIYEILSNSERTNCIFLEISRLLFNPNKSIVSLLGRKRESFGFC